MLEVKNLYKNFGEKTALKGINIDFKKGSIHGLVGVNGSGKSTLLNCIGGSYKGDGGEVLLNDTVVYENPAVKEKISYVEDENNFLSSYRIKDVLKLYSLTYKDFSSDEFHKLNEIFSLPIKAKVRSLSKGMKMRLSIMLSLSRNAEVILLDEPTNGLDPIIRKEFLKILGDYVYEKGATAIIASHNLTELERICDSITLLSSGEIKYSLTLDNLKEKVRKLQVMLPKGVEINHPSIVSVEKLGRVYYMVTNNYDKSLIKYLESLGADFIEEIDMSLEDMFIYTVGGEYSDLI